MVNKFYILVSLFLLLYQYGMTQKENAKWLFKPDVIVDFKINNTPIGSVVNNQFDFSRDGLSVVCSSEGDLLFYTDGDIVWDKTHTPMPNSDILVGDQYDFFEKSKVIKSHIDTNLYFLISLNNPFLEKEMYISTIDMRLRGGLGDVVPNSIYKISDIFLPGMVVTTHPCGGVWLIVHENNNNTFTSYHIYNGKIIYVQSQQIGSSISSSINNAFHSFGLKYSATTNKLVLLGSVFLLDIFDFNPYTGLISNHINILNETIFPYNGSLFDGEFSPSGQFFYVRQADNSEIWIAQYDMSLPTSEEIRNSKVLFSFPYPTTIFGIGGAASIHTFGTGIDGKIYLASPGIRDRLPVINDPDLKGTACNFDPYGFTVNSFITSFTIPELMIFESPRITDFLPPDTTFCPTSSISLSTSYVAYDSLRWSSGETLPSISVATPGLYSLELYKNGCTYTDTVHIAHAAVRSVDLGPDISLCGAETHTVSIGLSIGENVLWQDGITLSSRTITAPGMYRVTVTNNQGCAISDSILIHRSYDKVPKSITIPLCHEDTYTYRGNLYNSGDIIVDSLPAQIGCDTVLTITLTSLAPPTIYRDTTTCDNNSIILSGKTYQVGDTIVYIKPSSLGCDTTVQMIYKGSQISTLSLVASKETICTSESSTLTIQYLPILQTLQVLWQDESTLSSRTITAPGMYRVTVTNNQGCAISDSILIHKSYDKVPKSITIPLCHEDTYSYRGNLYNPGDIIVDSLPAQIGCDTVLTITLTSLSPPIIYLDTTTCDNSPFILSGKTYQVGDTIVSTRANLLSCDTTVNTIYKTYNRPTFTLTISDSILCTGEIATVKSSQAKNIQWSTGVYDSVVTVPSGNYAVNFTDEKGCVQNLSFTIKSAPSIEYIIEKQNPNCTQNDGSIRVIKKDISPPFVTLINNVTVLPNTALTDLNEGLYKLILTSDEGCVQSDTVQLISVQDYDISITENVIIDRGKLAHIPYITLGTPTDTIVFAPSMDIFAASDTIYVLGTEDKTYTITFVDIYGCKVTKTLMVEVTLLPSTFTLPNIVSLQESNSDNHLFYLKTPDVTYDLTIYDRWGNTLHQAIHVQGNDPNSAWSPREKRIVPGVYVYMLTIQTSDGVIQKVGTVTVL